MTASDTAFFSSMVAAMPRKRPPPRVSEYVERNRILPSSSPFGGYWKNAKTPYSVEIMDCMAPYSPVRRVIVKKGAQIGMTAAAENVVGYYMGALPSEILYVSATVELLNKWTKRLEPLIDSLGLRDKLTGGIDNPKTRRTGDKTLQKLYIGGALDMASAQSAPSLRSDSKRILIRDEIDGAPADLLTGEGNWLDVSEARTHAWGTRAKIFDLSTPGIEESSNVARAYLEGDAREWYMPCPHCGHMQHLGLTLEDYPKRFAPVIEEGHVREVVLMCESCAEGISESEKPGMIARGEWRATKAPELENVRSYHVPATISNMITWKDIYIDYNARKDSPLRIRSFVNLMLGLEYREAGRRPKIENVNILRGEYLKGTVPHGVIYLTAGIDIQTTAKNPRLEMEIVGHGLGYRTWGIDYKIFRGEVLSGLDLGAWKEINDWARHGGLSIPSVNGKYIHPVQLIFIDSGDGNITPTVYQFAQTWRNTFAIKGEQSIRLTHEKLEIEGDKPGKISEIGYQQSQIGKSGQYFYRIGTNYYKRIIYGNLETLRVHDSPRQPRGFSDFPADYSDEYFEQLLAEELRDDGSYHKTSAGAKNEALDTRVYALAAGDAWLHSKRNTAVENYKRAHPEIPIRQIEQNITVKSTLEYYAQEMGIELDD